MIRQVLSIQAAAQGWADARVSDARLKQYLKQTHELDARRLSRLSMLALAGGLAAAAQAPLCLRSSIYMGGAFSSPSVFQRMLDNVLSEQVAMPFDFLANIHNAPVYHVAAVLACQGAGVFLPLTPATWAQPLLLAANDIYLGVTDSALVGWCYEAPAHAGHDLSGSHWLVLRRGQTAATQPGLVLSGAPAAVRLPEGGEPETAYHFQAVADCLHGLEDAQYRHSLPISANAAMVVHGALGFTTQHLDFE